MKICSWCRRKFWGCCGNWQSRQLINQNRNQSISIYSLIIQLYLCINQYIADKMTNNNNYLCFKPYLCYIYTIYTESTKIRVQKLGTVGLDIGTTVIYFYYRVPVVLVNWQDGGNNLNQHQSPSNIKWYQHLE